PEADTGRHAKIHSLLADPAIAEDLRTYVRTNKWCMDPEKLAQFTCNELIPSAAKKYVHHITNYEMPLGLKRYMELDLFPRIGFKVARGISISTARCWLRREGFQYLPYKKGLY